MQSRESSKRKINFPGIDQVVLIDPQLYDVIIINTIRPLGYERVYLPLYKVADTPFHIQGDDIYVQSRESSRRKINFPGIDQLVLIDSQLYDVIIINIIRPLGYERVYLPLYKVADTPFMFKGR